MLTGKSQSTVGEWWRWIKAVSLVIQFQPTDPGSPDGPSWNTVVYRHLFEETPERLDETIEKDLGVTIEKDLVVAIEKDPIGSHDRFRQQQET